jgi:hypothetical protein
VTSAPALPSFRDQSKANLLPFATVCAFWLAPLLRFWVLVWGVYRPPDLADVDVAPRLWLFLASSAVCAAFWWMPSSYYRVRPFERSGRLYELLGVRLFRHLVPNGDLVNRWRRRRDPGFRVVTSRDAAAGYLPRTVAGEKSHLVMLAIGVGSSWFAWRIGWNGWAAYLGVANILVNVYPILLQRYTRARITQLAQRQGKKRGSADAEPLPVKASERTTGRLPSRPLVP